MSESLLMLSLPNSGSTWLGKLIAEHSRWDRYCTEFFNPLRNVKHYEVLHQHFGCELISCYGNIAGRERVLDEDIDSTWGRENFNFTKEVFSPFKLEAFARRFRCFVLLREPADSFPPQRLRVWSFYEHAWWALRAAGVVLEGLTVAARALAASRYMSARIEEDAHRIGVPLLRYRDLFDDTTLGLRMAEAIGEECAPVVAAIQATRTLTAR